MCPAKVLAAKFIASTAGPVRSIPTESKSARGGGFSPMATNKYPKNPSSVAFLYNSMGFIYSAIL